MSFGIFDTLVCVSHADYSITMPVLNSAKKTLGVEALVLELNVQ